MYATMQVHALSASTYMVKQYNWELIGYPCNLLIYSKIPPPMRQERVHICYMCRFIDHLWCKLCPILQHKDNKIRSNSKLISMKSLSRHRINHPSPPPSPTDPIRTHGPHNPYVPYVNEDVHTPVPSFEGMRIESTSSRGAQRRGDLLQSRMRLPRRAQPSSQ